MPTDLSIIVPCYNEAEHLPELVRRFRPSADRCSFELILVDNGSMDDSALVMARLMAEPGHQLVRIHRVPVNDGYGHGIMEGLRAARGQVLAYTHADLQCAPEDVLAAYEAWRVHPARERLLVKGRRVRRRANGALIPRGLQLFAPAILCMPLSDINGQPKLFGRQFLDELQHPPNDFTFDLYVLYRAHRAGWTVETVPVDFGLRRHGVSHWAFNWRSKLRTIGGFLRYILALRCHPS